MLLYNEDVGEKLTKALAVSAELERDHRIDRHSSLEKQLSNLALWGNYDMPDTIHCVISPDFAPLSFCFALYVECKPDYDKKLSRYGSWDHGRYMVEMFPQLEGRALYIHGGLIFHGKHDNGGDGSAPTFSVNLTSTNGWGTHT